MILSSEDELVERINDIDLVVIATPNYLHADTLIRLGQYDHLTILLEKPVAVSKEQHTRLTNALPTFQARVWIGMEYRYIPAIAKLIELIPTVVGDTVHMVTIRENRFPFLQKVQNWNRDGMKTGDSLVEKCCHFFDLMRLLSNREVQLDQIRSIVQRGINYQNEKTSFDTDATARTPIIDSAYVILPFHEKDDANVSTRPTNTSIGCLELCMFAEGSRHQEEVVVTGPLGRLEAYLPENKVYAYKRPIEKEWVDRTLPPPQHSIECTVYDCSNDGTVVYLDETMSSSTTPTAVPIHKGHHYCSTGMEWYKVMKAIHKYNESGIWKPEVSLMDGLHAVEIGLHATEKAL